MPPIDKAGRQIAGLLTYNPGPGIYSRLERAIQAMPENVRVQELPGLLKRYKDGVPGWELKATDLDSVIAGRDMVPRDELLGAVRERSPVYTHGEVVLGGNPQTKTFETGATGPSYAQSAGRIGGGQPVGRPKFQDYGQGGNDYGELLLLQPDAGMAEFGSHWTNANAPGAHNAVAHARYDTHGDALRINELQSDLGIHNRKVREEAGYDSIDGSEPPKELPFPMEDAWADLLIKRMALEAARGGHRAIEVASPRAIADKVGGNIDNYEHFYGKVVPGALERLGRKMGGLTTDTVPDAALEGMSAMESWMRARGMHRPAQFGYDEAHALRGSLNDRFPSGRDTGHRGVGDSAYHLIERVRNNAESADPVDQATYLRDVMWRNFEKQGMPDAEAMQMADAAMPEVLRQYEVMRAARNRNWDYGEQMTADVAKPSGNTPPGRRYLMSDEMRRRLIQEGVGAAVAGGLMSQDDLIERLGQ